MGDSKKFDLEKTSLPSSASTSDKSYRQLFESSQDGILLLNAWTSQIEDVNPSLIGLLGYAHEEFLGKHIWEVAVFKNSALSKEAFVGLQIKGHIRYAKLAMQTKDGQQIGVEFTCNLSNYDGVAVIQCTVRNITAQVLAERALRMTARALRVINDTNSVSTNAPDERELLSAICRVLVETGGYSMAWVGYADEAGGNLVQPMAYYGYEQGFLKIAEISWGYTEAGLGPTGNAIRSGEVQFVEDIASDTRSLPWKAEALQRGYRSVIALPLRNASGLLGCVTAYGSAIEIWPSEEQALLQELAVNLAHGIATQRTLAADRKNESALRDSLEQSIQAIAATIDKRHTKTAGHQHRVASLCTEIAALLGLEDDRIHGLRLAATLHDVGKLNVPVELFNKTKHLTAKEYALIRQHASLGFEMVKDIQFPWPIAQIILQHHERMNGSGYPQGLKGSQMLLESKILAVADVVEAISSHSTYRPALGIKAALVEIVAQRGILFDGSVVDACVSLFEDKGYKLPELHGPN
jgi:PAS domain S-box-containing protein/putative nucleotidyltransferase with HDIG domain